MPRHGELLTAAHFAGFDENDVTTRWRPNQAHRDSRFCDSFLHFLLNPHFLYAQRIANHFRRDDMFFHLAFSNPASLLAYERREFTLKVSHTCFARVVSDQVMQSLICELNLLTQHDAVLFRLARDQETLCDPDLLFFGVSGELDDLMRSRNGSGMGSIQFAVATKRTFDRSNGTS